MVLLSVVLVVELVPLLVLLVGVKGTRVMACMVSEKTASMTMYSVGPHAGSLAGASANEHYGYINSKLSLLIASFTIDTVQVPEMQVSESPV